MKNLLNYVKVLEFDEEPDYKGIKLLFKNKIEKNRDNMNWEFDWDKQKVENSKVEDEDEKENDDEKDKSEK